MKIGIFGASGFIGYELFKFYQLLGTDIIGTYNSTPQDGLVKLDILTGNFSIFDSCDVVIIAGGITNIDKCKTDRQLAYKINVEKTLELIQYLSMRNIKPLFLSTDNVFDGEKGNYSETDSPNPINAYGEFKTKVEQFMLAELNNYLIARLSKNYSKNFTNRTIFSELIESLTNNKKIFLAKDLICNPSEIQETIMLLDNLIRHQAQGIYHVAENKIESRYDFGIRLAEKYGLDKKLITKINIEELSLTEPRPLNVSLDTNKIQKFIKTTREN